MPYKDPETRKAKQREYNRKWRLANPDYHKKWIKNNPDKVKHYAGKVDKEYQKEASRRFRERNPGYRNKYKDSAKRYVENNKDKHYARVAVWRALKTGKLVKPPNCEHCGSDTKLEGDHADYSKRLEVTWLCRPCHVKVTNQRAII